VRKSEANGREVTAGTKRYPCREGSRGIGVQPLGTKDSWTRDSPIQLQGGMVLGTTLRFTARDCLRGREPSCPLQD
jgi:hypothetical protein